MNHIVLFDGVCNLCNWAVNFIMKHDPAQNFKFASLQSEKGKELLREFNVSLDEESVVFIRKDGRTFVKSDAALNICSHLKGPVKFLSIFTLLPRFLRDSVYSFIARIRYKFFGKKEACRIPTKEERARFID